MYSPIRLSNKYKYRIVIVQTLVICQAKSCSLLKVHFIIFHFSTCFHWSRYVKYLHVLKKNKIKKEERERERELLWLHVLNKQSNCTTTNRTHEILASGYLPFFLKKKNSYLNVVFVITNPLRVYVVYFFCIFPLSGTISRCIWKIAFLTISKLISFLA